MGVEAAGLDQYGASVFLYDLDHLKSGSGGALIKC